MSAANVFTFTWKIENYSKLSLKADDYLHSNTFVTHYFGRDEWYLKFYSNRKAETEHNDVCCTLFRKTGGDLIRLDITFQLIDPYNNVFATKKQKATSQVRNSYCDLSLITTEELKNKTNTWKEDALTIRCILSILTQREISHDFKYNLRIGVINSTFAWCIKEPDSPEWSSTKMCTFTDITSLEVILTAPADDIIIEIKNKPIVVSGTSCVTCKITVFDVANVKKFAKTDNYKFDNADSNDQWNFPKFLTRKGLKNKNCIENGYFTLNIEFSVPNGINKEFESQIEYKLISGAKSFQDVDSPTILQDNLKKMYLDKKHSDVSLEANGELFCAHKCILSSRSPVFHAMFDCETLENKTNIVNITDLDSTTLGNFLTFLYTGTIDDSKCENILKLMVAADKYQVESLTEKCAQILMFSLTEKNACNIFVIADKFKLTILKASLWKFIEEHATTFLVSKEWSKWAKENMDLAFEITSTLALKFANNSKEEPKSNMLL